MLCLSKNTFKETSCNKQKLKINIIIIITLRIFRNILSKNEFRFPLALFPTNDIVDSSVLHE